jgi:hypothetical protein
MTFISIVPPMLLLPLSGRRHPEGHRENSSLFFTYLQHSGVAHTGVQHPGVGQPTSAYPYISEI